MPEELNGLKLPQPTDIPRPQDVDEDIFHEFVTSNESSIENLEAAALRLEADPTDAEPLQEAKRILHTIKGETAFLDMNRVSEICHQAESVLSDILDAGQSPTDFLLTVKDWLQGLLVHLKNPDGPAEGGRGQASDVETPEDASSQPGLRSLVVEDDVTCQTILRGFLEEFGPVSVTADGREGFDAFCHAVEVGRPYDLVCLDIMMPRMSGQELLARIRKHEAEHGVLGLDGVKIIMTTALGDAKNVMKAFRAGCEAYVVKPIQRAKLLKEMRELELIP